jgi:N-acetylmuramoyl-L-alanine amidase
VRIIDHKLEGDNVSFQQTPNVSGTFGAGLPDSIVIHFTAGRSLESSVAWLCNSKARASAHFVIGKAGKVVQLAKLDTKTWHAGKSSWEGRSGFNSYSIGIEIDNAGRLEKRESGFYTWFGVKVPDEKVVSRIHRNENEASYWESYTTEQIEIVEALCSLLIDQYGIKQILGHEEISPGRKVDPGPASLLYNDRSTEEQSDYTSSGDLGMVNADYLNFRSNPSSSALTITEPLKRGTLVEILEEKNGWTKVRLEGWVSGKWIKRVKQ